MLRSEKLKFVSAIFALTILGTLILGSAATVSAQEDDGYVPPTPPGPPIPAETWILGIGIAIIAVIMILGLLGLPPFRRSPR